MRESHPLPLRASIAAVLLLSACGKPETIVADNAPGRYAGAAQCRQAGGTSPAMTASKSYRCKDDRLVFDGLLRGRQAGDRPPGQEGRDPRRAEGRRGRQAADRRRLYAEGARVPTVSDRPPGQTGAELQGASASSPSARGRPRDDSRRPPAAAGACRLRPASSPSMRRCISSTGTSSTWVESVHSWPKGSAALPERSP